MPMTLTPIPFVFTLDATWSRPAIQTPRWRVVHGRQTTTVSAPTEAEAIAQLAKVGIVNITSISRA
jgi:hypothetical protein